MQETMTMTVVPAEITSPVSYAFEQSDNFSKSIVILLMVLSVYAWSIMG